VFLTGAFFGFTDAFGIRLQTTTNIPPALVQFLPQVFTLLALILVAARGKIREAVARRAFRSRARQERATHEAEQMSGA
jgi:ABC-type uncharacterized transport system permease subunit